MKKLLKELSDILVATKSPLNDVLQKGINTNTIKGWARKYKINLPKEVYELYEWKNGVDFEKAEDIDIDPNLFKLGIFNSLEESFEYYEYYTKNGYWNEDFFPLFNSGGGDFYLIDIKKESGKHGMIYYFSPSNPDFKGFITMSDSLKSLISTVITCYEKNAYKYDYSINSLIFNPELENKIFKDLNPKSDYWKLF